METLLCLVTVAKQRVWTVGIKDLTIRKSVLLKTEGIPIQILGGTFEYKKEFKMWGK